MRHNEAAAVRRVLKQVQDPYAVATATAQEMGYDDFSEGSPGQEKRDEIAEAIKDQRKSRDPRAVMTGLDTLVKRLSR